MKMNAREYGRDNCLLPCQTQAAKDSGYVAAGHIKQYTLSPEELAEVQRKYGKPGVKPKKEEWYVSAKRSKPLISEKGRKHKPTTAKIEAPPRPPKPEKERLKVAVKPVKERKPAYRPQTRMLTKEEVETALEGRTIKQAREFLHVGNDVLYRHIREYGIKYYNRHLAERDAYGKVCGGPCGLYKEYGEYNKNRSMLDGYENYCRECFNERRRKKRAEKKC